MTVRSLVIIEKESLAMSQSTLTEATLKVQEHSDPPLDVVVSDLIDTMRTHPTCIGLAAPQIGHNLRVAVVRDEVTPSGKDLVIVNPIILSISGKGDGKDEACMSLPGWTGLVKRKLDIELRFQNEEGVEQILQAEQFFSRVIQHEVDHLDGVLYPFRMRPDDKLRRRERADSDPK